MNPATGGEPRAAGVPEELFLLMVSRGKIVPEGLVGAVLAELVMRGRLSVSGKDLVVVDGSRTGDEIVDDALEVIVGESRRRKVDWWLGRLRKRLPTLVSRYAERLEKRGLVAQEKRRWLLVRSRTVFVSTDASAPREIAERLRSALEAERPPSLHDASLLLLLVSLYMARSMMPALYAERRERSEAEKRIGAIDRSPLNGEPEWPGVRRVADAVGQLVMSTYSPPPPTVTS